MQTENNYTIRLERKEDNRNVENLVRNSFWNVYRPGCLEHYVLHTLRTNKDFVPELDFVLEKEGEIIGQNVFVRGQIRADNGRNVPVLAMGPICIKRELQRQGYGKILLDYCLEKATALGYGAVCFEGDIGFTAKAGLVLHATLGCATTDCLPERTIRSSCVRNCDLGI